MKIIKNREKLDAIDVFRSIEQFIDFINQNYPSVNLKYNVILSKTKEIYNNIINQDGSVRFNRLSRWLPGQYGFKHKNTRQIEFWKERGWSDEDAFSRVSSYNADTAKKGIKTKKEDKNDILFNGNEFKITYKTVEFESKTHPICNNCNSKLMLIKRNINNNKGEFYYEIIGCSNNSCDSKSLRKTEKYKALLPEPISNLKLAELEIINRNTNPLCKEYWVMKGLSSSDAENKISNIQKYNSNKVENNFIPSKENLRKRGFSEEDISDICKAPTQIDFWIKKGYSKKEAKDIITENQSNAASFVDYGKRLLPSNVDYWINKGFSYKEAKNKVSESQKTFSLDICIEKYGEEEGRNRWLERQEKWHSNYKKSNFSKVSQELFWEIYNKLSDEYKCENDIYFATLGDGGLLDESGSNNEYRLMLEESFILPDFFVKNKNKIIEFDGTYYHRDNVENKKREKLRDESIINSGYEVLHIKESDYKNKKEYVINVCIDFLLK